MSNHSVTDVTNSIFLKYTYIKCKNAPQVSLYNPEVQEEAGIILEFVAVTREFS